MTRYVIEPEVAFRLAQENAVVAAQHQLLAPTLFRSQLLALLFRSVQSQEITRREAERCLAYVRGLRLRLLGDRVLQSVAWSIADWLGWPDTLQAEYIALTRLQADAFVTLDENLAAEAQVVVPLAPYEVLIQ